MTARKTLDQMTSDDLDALHAELAALRTVARGYCPACGRGDAAPSVADWERERQRAETAESRLATAQAQIRADSIAMEQTGKERDALGRETGRLRKDWTTMRDRAEHAEAAVTRVRDFAADIERSGWTGPAIARRIRAALDGAPASAGTEETEPQEQP